MYDKNKARLAGSEQLPVDDMEESDYDDDTKNHNTAANNLDDLEYKDFFLN